MAVLEGTFRAGGSSFISSSACSARGPVSSVLSPTASEVETGCGESVSSRGEMTSDSS